MRPFFLILKTFEVLEMCVDIGSSIKILILQKGTLELAHLIGMGGSTHFFKYRPHYFVHNLQLRNIFTFKNQSGNFFKLEAARSRIRSQKRHREDFF